MSENSEETKAVEARLLDELTASRARLDRIEKKNGEREAAFLRMKDCYNAYKKAKSTYDELQGQLDDLIHGNRRLPERDHVRQRSLRLLAATVGRAYQASPRVAAVRARGPESGERRATTDQR